MKRISKDSGAIEVGGGGRKGSSGGGRTGIAPAIPVPIEALTNLPKSSAGQVVNCPATRVRTDSAADQRRSRRRSLLTIGARCCVISPDCIQNVDNSQPLAPHVLSPRPAGTSAISPSGIRSSVQRARRSAWMVTLLDHGDDGAP